MTEPTLRSAMQAFAGLTHGFGEEDLANEGWAWKEYEGVRYAFLQSYLEMRQLAATLLVERATQSTPRTLAQTSLAQYHAAYRDFVSLYIDVLEEDLDALPAEGAWPLRRILTHIIRTEQRYFHVVQYALECYHAGQVIERMPEERVEYLNDPELRAIFAGSLAGILTYYRDAHWSILDKLAGITDEELNAPTLWWEGEPYPVRFRIHRLDAHLREHTIQAERALDAIGRPLSEVVHLLRLLYAALAEIEGVSIGKPEFGRNRRYALAKTLMARAESVTDFVAGTKFYG